MENAEPANAVLIAVQLKHPGLYCCDAADTDGCHARLVAALSWTPVGLEKRQNCWSCWLMTSKPCKALLYPAQQPGASDRFLNAAFRKQVAGGQQSSLCVAVKQQGQCLAWWRP